MNELSISNGFASSPIYYIKETDSTMSLARTLALNGAENGTLVTTDFQFQGRGRLAGRKWDSQRGENLLFSIILLKQTISLKNVSVFPLLAGLAVARTLEKKCSLPVKIKWPNDIYMDNKKVCGILSESFKGFLVAGMGLNVNQENFPQDLLQKAGSLKSICGRNFDKYEILSLLTKELFELCTTGDWLEDVQSHLYKKGETVRFLPGDPGKKEEIIAVIEGIHSDGALCLNDKGQSRIYYSGELRID